MTDKAGKYSPAIDNFILNSAEFAQPVLEHIRGLVHLACPETDETLKWNFPHFMYKNKILCSMAAFKSHCAFSFWNSQHIDDKGLLEKSERTAMGHLGKITSLNDLPSDNQFVRLIKDAMRSIDDGKKIVKANKAPREILEMPASFKSALKTNALASAQFNQFSPSKRNEYLMWLMEAKTESTLNKRIDLAIEWIAEGKSRNWKYEKK